MTEKSLVSLFQQQSAVLRMIMEAGGELTPELEQQLQQVETGIPEKVDGYAFFEDRLKHEAEWWKNRAKESQRVQKSLERAVDILRTRLKYIMEHEGLLELKGVSSKYRLKIGGKKVVIDESGLDPAYMMPVTTMVPDKERIRADLEAGKEVKGATIEVIKSLQQFANKPE